MFNPEIPVHSVYIHWPFCPYKCHFCPFVAFAGKDSFMEQYHQALVREIIAFAVVAHEKHALNTVYFGGGTPSTYPNELLLDMLGILKNVFIISGHTEITLEVNPGTVDKQKLRTWQQAGINRLSIGVQSLKDRVLTDLNRKQSRDDVLQLMSYVGDFFSNISVDIILGLPGVNDQEWRDLLEQVVTWPVKHVSMYLLEIHEGTALHVRVNKKDVILPEDERLAELYTWSVEFLEQHGFEQYEVSSFARPGYQSRHNQVYWDYKPYKGFGIGACSFDGSTRFANGSDMKVYLEALQEGNVSPCTSEKITRQQMINEKMMLGVRRRDGFSLAEIYQALTADEWVKLQVNIDQLKRGDLVIERDNRLILTPRGLLVENGIATRLAL